MTGRVPKKRASRLSSRLSPIRKTSPSGTVIGPKFLRAGFSGRTRIGCVRAPSDSVPRISTSPSSRVRGGRNSSFWGFPFTKSASLRSSTTSPGRPMSRLTNGTLPPSGFRTTTTSPRFGSPVRIRRTFVNGRRIW